MVPLLVSKLVVVLVYAASPAHVTASPDSSRFMFSLEMRIATNMGFGFAGFKAETIHVTGVVLLWAIEDESCVANCLLMRKQFDSTMFDVRTRHIHVGVLRQIHQTESGKFSRNEWFLNFHFHISCARKFMIPYHRFHL
jgi:hypothetical protein